MLFDLFCDPLNLPIHPGNDWKIECLWSLGHISTTLSFPSLVLSSGNDNDGMWWIADAVKSVIGHDQAPWCSLIWNWLVVAWCSAGIYIHTRMTLWAQGDSSKHWSQLTTFKSNWRQISRDLKFVSYWNPRYALVLEYILHICYLKNDYVFLFSALMGPDVATNPSGKHIVLCLGVIVKGCCKERFLSCWGFQEGL